MGMITDFFGMLFGGNRNILVETAEVFRENTENAAERSVSVQTAALQQFAEEFRAVQRSPFDRLIDGLNRLPRPMMAFGTLGLITAAMIAPDWFSTRMEGLGLVPEPLWWLMGAVVSFYFGARHQAKGLEFQQSIAETLLRKRHVTRAAPDIEAPEAATVGNAALAEWRAQNGT